MEKVTARFIPIPATPLPKRPKSKPAVPKPRKLWDNHKEVAVIQKSDRLRIAVDACTRDGFRCLSIREYYFAKRDGVWKPGRDGIIVPIMAPIGKTRTPDPNNPPKMIYPLKELLKALVLATDVAMEMDLEDPENEVWLMPKQTVEETEE